MKFDYLNTFISKHGIKLGHTGCYGGEADSPQHAVEIATQAAKDSRKIMGFPFTVKTEITFSQEL